MSCTYSFSSIYVLGTFVVRGEEKSWPLGGILLERVEDLAVVAELTDEAFLSTQTAAVHVGTGKLDHFGEEGSQLPIYYLYRGWRKGQKKNEWRSMEQTKGTCNKKTNQNRDPNSVTVWTKLQAEYYDDDDIDISTRNRRLLYWIYQSCVIIWVFSGKTNTS